MSLIWLAVKKVQNTENREAENMEVARITGLPWNHRYFWGYEGTQNYLRKVRIQVHTLATGRVWTVLNCRCWRAGDCNQTSGASSGNVLTRMMRQTVTLMFLIHSVNIWWLSFSICLEHFEQQQTNLDIKKTKTGWIVCLWRPFWRC